MGVTVILLFIHFAFREPDLNEQFRSVALVAAGNANARIRLLEQAATDYKAGKKNLAALRKQLLETRKAYKGIEYLLEYYYPEHVKEYINGPPLFHQDPYPHDTSINNDYYGGGIEAYLNSAPLDYLEHDHYKTAPRVIEPRGLQVLDELIFADEAETGKEKIITLTRELTTKFDVLVQALNKRKYFQDYEMIEAIRLELVRMFTLGVTGFDTPGSRNALEECGASLKALQKVTEPFLTQISDSSAQQVRMLFKNSIRYVQKNKDFDTFDRLVFLTTCINPLYSALLDVHCQLKLRSTAEITRTIPAWNFYSKNLFAENFLNPYHYTQLKEHRDSDELRSLGRKLFYDPRMSRNNAMSCGSCHQPLKAFTDGVSRSFASVEGKNVLRNAPTLINAVYADRYFYDLRAFDLEEQGEHVIESHMEFNTSFPELLEKINADVQYKKAFDAVFHNSGKPVNRHQFSAALTSYVLSLRSFNSEFDRFVRGEKKTLAADVRHGFNLFMGKASCGTCHYPPTFAGLVPPHYEENESEVLGVLEKPLAFKVDGDRGRMDNAVETENIEIYRRSFKTASIRNIAYTAPYFHNGSYASLEEVIDFYDHGGAQGAGLTDQIPNQTLAPDSLHLSSYEKQALIAFLRSLSDSTAVATYSSY